MTFDSTTFLAVTRLGGLVAGPGDRLALGAASPGRDGKAFETGLRAVDPETGAVRWLVAPRSGSAAAGFTRGGDLLFVARRDDPQAPEAEKVGDSASLWLLPAAGGEARRLVSAPAGVGGVAAARDADVIIVKVDVFPTAVTLEDDRLAATAREDAGTSALLWEDYPIRYWDHPLAPRQPRLLVTDTAGSPLRDLTGAVGHALTEQDMTVTPDGSTVITGWATPVGGGEDRYDLVAIDVATGGRTVLVTDDAYAHASPAVSPDGRWVAYSRERLTDQQLSPAVELWLLERSTGDRRRLAPELDRWPEGFSFTADSASVVVDGADSGRHSVWVVPLEPTGAAATRLSDAGSFTDVRPSWEGGRVFALRSTIGAPPELVTLDVAAAEQEPRVLHAEGFSDDLPGRVEEVTTTAADGTPLRAWLVLPEGAQGPAPLALVIHGGPLGSWNAWQWRWQPMLLAARGYAVLLPDPALSTGYGQRMVDRGWGQWGGAPWEDVLALTDAALARDDLDAERTAVLGGSYGGYLTNWAITHTDRFRCAVTHASLWDLTSFRGTTDNAAFWEREFGHPRRDRGFYERWSPATHADAIVTPTLVIHGEQDFRVPVGEGLGLYAELQRSGIPSQLLYFPDENHWVLKPGNISVWYDAVLAWLDRWVLGAAPRRPDLV